MPTTLKRDNLLSFANSSRWEFAKDKRLSLFKVVGIQDPPSNCCVKAGGHNIRYPERATNLRIVASTCLRRFCKTSSDALRTFKSFRASCYSGVPCFHRNPEALTVGKKRYTGFRRVA